MGTLHEDLHAFLCMEMTGWGIIRLFWLPWLPWLLWVPWLPRESPTSHATTRRILCDNVITQIGTRHPAHMNVECHWRRITVMLLAPFTNVKGQFLANMPELLHCAHISPVPGQRDISPKITTEVWLLLHGLCFILLII
jgi:hypothetical protein